MTNKQIKKLIFAAIVFVLLAYGAFWLLLRPSGLDSNTAVNHFTKHRESYENTANYLIANKYNTEITDYLTIDNHYGISSEDTPEYRKFADGVDDLMTGVSLDAISAEGTVVRFKMQPEGGILTKEHVEVICCKEMQPYGATPLGYENWYYEIVED